VQGAGGVGLFQLIIQEITHLKHAYRNFPKKKKNSGDGFWQKLESLLLPEEDLGGLNARGRLGGSECLAGGGATIAAQVRDRDDMLLCTYTEC
jgi:hypothetical protein